MALASHHEMAGTPTKANVARDVLLAHSPLTAIMVNAILVFITFLLSLPALALPATRGWLRAHGWLVVACAIFTLVLGLDIWFTTLKTRANLSTIFDEQSAQVKSLLQQRFNCCGYLDSVTFQQDFICPSVAAAAQKQGCVGNFSNYANGFLDLIFTAFFGFVALDVILLLNTAMVLKDRQETERYRHIDEKNGFGGL
ncbi:MAG: phospholipid scramblase 1 [Pycnora praestabilis]|nr:MAG: phospholipid scramblase 1 [Pycnora praestabilis]